jgi:hypothetical protein
MTKPLRIAVVRGESLMEQGVLHALAEIEGLEVEVLPGDAADLAAALRTFRPDAVIADEMERTFIDYILATSPGTVVVTLSVHVPKIGVYRSKQVPVASVADLVSQLRDEVDKTIRDGAAIA